MITIVNKNDELVIKVHKGMFGGLSVDQGDDLIYVDPDNIKLFVAAVRAVATDMLGEEV
jgi:hypothetical protein